MAKGKKCEILVINQIAQVGLKRFPAERYAVVKESNDPWAILVRSQDLHQYEFGPSLRAVGRAGAGTNNIPVAEMSKRGIPVFNAPGANANAVKELVLAGMLIAARNLVPAIRFTDGLAGTDEEIEKKVEEGKKVFAGVELPQHVLGIIGLGKVGSLVADAAIKLGMEVFGYDPDITVDAAWSLPSQVRKAHSIEEVLRNSDFVSLHIPLLDGTRKLIDARRIGLMKPGTVLLNFSRDGIVDNAAVLDALDAKKLKAYVCDFPGARFTGHQAVVATPHLGASTEEAEENCAIMVVDQVRDYLENGAIANAVNFPNVDMPRESPYLVAIANANVPNMLGQISTTMAHAGLNIHNMVNKSRGEMAYTLVDVDSPIQPSVVDAISAIQGVL